MWLVYHGQCLLVLACDQRLLVHLPCAVQIGLVGYPNVGKSSTINALFGAKKTAVAPTPGKTKHFQTLIVSPSLCLCDCPGEQ
jgi:large subunit GTPase 1